MSILFLTSIASKTLDLLTPRLDKKPSELEVCFISNAADVYEDTWFVEDDKRKLLDLGYKVKVMDLKVTYGKELVDILNNSNIIFVAGGNVFYLLELAQKSGFFDYLKTSFPRSNKVFIGSSAGSALVSRDLSPATFFDDPAKAPNLKSYDGVGLVDFTLLPHFGNPKYKDQYVAFFKKYYAGNYSFLTISDEQALIMINGKMQLLTVPKRS